LNHNDPLDARVIAKINMGVHCLGLAISEYRDIAGKSKH